MAKDHKAYETVRMYTRAGFRIGELAAITWHPMEIVNATGVLQAYLGLQARHDVGIAQRAQQASCHAHCQRATRPDHHVCGRADGNAACQRGVLDMHLQAGNPLTIVPAVMDGMLVSSSIFDQEQTCFLLCTTTSSLQ